MLTEEAVSKVILCGEHSAVYGYPAIALPFNNCRVRVSVYSNNTQENDIIIKAPDIGSDFYLDLKKEKQDYHPIELIVINFLRKYKIEGLNKLTMEISSNIPIESGMGSGAAISTGIIKALSAFYSKLITKEEIFDLVFETEKIYHGNPSGIDAKVIIHEKPVYFIKALKTEFIEIKSNFALAVIDSGLRSPTRDVVNWLNKSRQNKPGWHNHIFEQIGEIAQNIKSLLMTQEITIIGELLNKNHFYLQQLGISNAKLDELVEKCIRAGALGSKLSGAGWGGIVIAILENENVQGFKSALEDLGINDIKISLF